MEKCKVRSLRYENFKDSAISLFLSCGHFIDFLLLVVRGNFYVFFSFFNFLPISSENRYFLRCFGVAETYVHQINAENTFSEPCGKK